MDIQMPAMDGIEATQYIRNKMKDAVSNIPIIALTANVFKGDIKEYIKAGMNDYIFKPFKSKELFHKIVKNIGLEAHNLPLTKEKSKNEITGNIASKSKHQENIYDINIFKEFANNDNTLLVEMIQLFVDKTSEGLEQIKTHLDNKEWDKLHFVVHKIKPSIIYMKLKNIEEKLNEIERITKEKSNFEELPELIEYIDKELNRVFVLLKDEIRKYS